MLGMSAAYSAYVYTFGVDTTAGIKLTDKEIKITDVNFISTSSCGYEVFNASFTKTDININVDLPYLNCSVIYEVIIENKMDTHMEISDIVIDLNNDYISAFFLALEEGNIILSGESKKAMLVIRYKEDIDILPDNTKHGVLIELEYSNPHLSGAGAMVTFDKVGWTNNNVSATVTFDQNVEILNNNGSNEYVFTENGSFTFEYENSNNIKGTVTVNVTWIDKEPPNSVTGKVVETTNESITINASALDTGSGVGAFFYRINEGNFIGPTDISYTFKGLNSNTEYIISIKAMDNAGNESEVINISSRTR